MNGSTLPQNSWLSRLWRATGLSRPAALQVAALCYRQTGNGHEVLLITSKGRGNWILPKGWPKARKSFADMAAQEAFEEAGVKGKIGAEPIGRFQYDKRFPFGASLDCEAEVYPLHVSETAESYPESGMRDVKWCSPNEAAKLVDNHQLRELLLDFEP